MKLAIDGPSGAGKSTVAKLIARELGLVYIDTGAMYRALTWKALCTGLNIEDPSALCQLAMATDIHFQPESNNQRVICDGKDVSEAIRSPQVNSVVSTVAAQPLVRQVMVSKQQDMARSGNVVMDGRDIGEFVLPDADFKFFLTADIEERSRRRALELLDKGYTVDQETVRTEMENRDKKDSTREVGALKVLPGSIIIDSSGLNVNQVLEKMLSIIRKV